MDKILYLDPETGEQKERGATAEETAELAQRRAAGPSPEMVNAPILAALEAIDAKSIRPLREGDVVRVAALEAEAAALRAQLVKV